MNVESILSSEFLDQMLDHLADRVIEKMKPLLNNNGKHDNDVIFDVKGLAGYLNVSPKWIYQKVQYKEIPHIKRKGLLRFRKKDIDRWLDSHSIPSVK